MNGKTWNWLEYLKDPYHVWKFQQYFGVEKVKMVEQVKDGKFQSKHINDYLKSTNNMLGGNTNDSKIINNKNSTTKTIVSSDEDYLSSSGAEEVVDGSSNKNVIYYQINSWFWYFLFLFGTQLGDETYYSIFFCFWFWNIDGAVGRRVILVWNLIMYIGQGAKDVIRWERPEMPPVIQLESKWALEYGMPSTHAMVGLAIPTSILYFTYGRYQYPFALWAAVALIWCTLVCTSRIYLGMHSLADILVGLVASASLLVFVVVIADSSDHFLLSNPMAPIVTIALSLGGLYFYPGSDRWTPARGDTTVILGSYLGTQLGNWCNYQLGILKGPPLQPPYPILWPTYETYVVTILRMAIGGVVIIATRAIAKPLVFYTSAFIVNANPAELKLQKPTVENKKKLVTELTTKFFAYLAVGFSCTFIVPIVFRVISCERATFHTEV